MTASGKLLADYASNHSEAAFRELVDRYLNLVYSAALRLVDGDAHAAEDITQMVFADLARQAKTMAPEVMLGGWLHRHTCFVAAKFLRGERRRHFRERQAVQMNAIPDHSAANLAAVTPLLDEAIDSLGVEDRAAILLRFFERRDFRSVGEGLGITEAAAQKRVARALEKLHTLLRHRGVAFSLGALGTALASSAVLAAPAGLAASIATAALSSPALSAGTALTALKIMTLTKLKLGVIGALVVAGVTVPLVVQHQTQARLRDDNQTLRQQLAQLTSLATENERLSNLVSQAQSAAALSQDQMNELLRLRGEVGGLRRQKKELEQLQAAKSSLHSSNAPASPEAVLENSISKGAWAFVGYATPEGALQSVMWAMSQGDTKTYLASLTPEAQQAVLKQFEGKSESEIAALLKQETSQIGALRLDRKQAISANEVSFVVFSKEQDNGAARMRDEAVMKFEQIGGEWKFAATH